MTDRICLITGATDGVGKVTAIELARRGYTVIVAARDAAKAERATYEIATTSGNGRVDFLVGDLASLGQIRRLAETFSESYPRLDVLVNNAGVFLPRRAVTEDGFETMFQVNYLAHFLLTRLLLPKLTGSDQGRIVNLSSNVYSIGKLELANLQGDKAFSSLGAYAAAKLFNLMFTEELAKRLAGTRVTANVVHPGIVRTRMMLRAPGLFRLVSYLALPFSISPRKGARTTVHVATSPDLAGVSGRYFTRSRMLATKNRFDTEANRAALWDHSSRLLGLEDLATVRHAS